MSAGDIRTQWLKRTIVYATVLWALWTGSIASAIDNPDASDRIAEFESRSQPYIDAILVLAQDELEIARAYSDYEHFLDVELNRAYKDLLSELDDQQRRKLVASQKRWLQFRDAESEFINSNWVPENFGSSYKITRYASKIRVLRSRVIDLLQYLMSYPSAN